MCCLGVSFVIGGPDEAVLVSGVGYDRPKILHQVKEKYLSCVKIGNWPVGTFSIRVSAVEATFPATATAETAGTITFAVCLL